MVVDFVGVGVVLIGFGGLFCGGSCGSVLVMGLVSVSVICVVMFCVILWMLMIGLGGSRFCCGGSACVIRFLSSLFVCLGWVGVGVVMIVLCCCLCCVLLIGLNWMLSIVTGKLLKNQIGRAHV